MKRVFLPLFIFMIALLSTNAQITPRQKDSILQIFPSVSGVEKLQLTDKLINYYQQNQPDSAKYYNDILLREARQQVNKKYIALYHYNLGIYYTFQSKYYDAISSYNKAVAIQKDAHLDNDLADTYKAMSGNYHNLTNYNKTLEMSYKALKIYEQLQNQKGVVSILNNLASVHSEIDDIITATRLYLKAIKIIDSFHLKKSKAILYNNLGDVYRDRKKYDSARYYYQKSISIAKKNNNKQLLTITYNNLYFFYFDIKNRDSANYYIEKSLNYAKKYNKSMLLKTQYNKANMFLNMGVINQGLALMNEVLQSAKLKDDKEIKELAYFKLYETYKKQHKWQPALRNLEDLMDIQDTLNWENTKLKIAKLEAKYQNEKKQVKIEQLELKQKLDKKIKTYLTLAIALLFLSFALTGYNFINKQKRNRLEKELLKTEKEKLHQDVRFKTKQLTSQALMMMQKNKLIDDILSQLSTIKGAGVPLTDLNKLKRKLKKSLHSEDDWELFKHYFEEINKDFFKRLKQINPKITPAEQRLAALVKLRFNIKETAELLNISPDSVKTARSQLRKKLGLASGKNMYEFLNLTF